MNKRIFFVLWLCLLTCMSNCFGAAGLLPAGTAAPTPFPGNIVVNVSPGNGTISAAVNAHGSNCTYVLSNGNYTDANINCSLNNVQFIGSSAANVTITVSGGGRPILFNGNNPGNHVQIWGLTMDAAGIESYIVAGPQLSNLLLQNCHIRNYASNLSGQECFPIYLFGNSNNTSNQTVDSCQFTPSASNNHDGVTVVDCGALPPTYNYTNITVSNNLFDTPTDTGTVYYHCMGSSVQNVTGNVWVAPNFSMAGLTQFVYGEPGSASGSTGAQDNGSNTCTMTGNTVTLGPGSDFIGITMHPNGVEPSYAVHGNTINYGPGPSAGYVFGLYPYQGCSTVQTNSVNSVVITNNYIDPLINPMTYLGCEVGTIVTSPNNGVTGVTSLTASAPNPITATSATLIGTVTSNNGSNITTTGFDWGTTTNYGTSPNVGTIVQSGNYSLQLNNLTQGQQYHYRARAVNSSGTGFSSDVLFIPSTPKPTPTAAPTPTPGGTKTPAYVQGNYATPQTGQTIVGVPFNSAQLAGDTNVVVVGWNDTTSLAPTRGGALRRPRRKPSAYSRRGRAWRPSGRCPPDRAVDDVPAFCLASSRESSLNGLTAAKVTRRVPPLGRSRCAI